MQPEFWQCEPTTNSSSIVVWHGGKQARQRSDGIAVGVLPGGKEEKVAGADCKEDIGVGYTNGHKGDKRPPATSI